MMIKPEFRQIPIADLTVSLEDFQGRSEAFSSTTYNRIVNEVRDGIFNFSALPPIMVWKDNRTHKWVILAGHSRTAAFSDLSKGKHPMDPKYKPSDFDEIHAQVFFSENKEDALEEAKKVAQESNLAGEQSLIDFAFKVVKPLRETSKSNSAYWEKMENLFGANKRFVHKVSFLNPNGKTISMWQATKNLSDQLQRKTIETIATLIGVARERMPELTDGHENELYDWLIKNFAEQAKAEKEGRSFKGPKMNSEAAFLELVSSRIMRLGWTPNQPLNLDLVGAESVYQKTFRETDKEKEDQIRELQKAYDADKQKLIALNWSTEDIESKLDPQERYIIRLQRELAAYRLSQPSQVSQAERSELSLFDMAAPVAAAPAPKQQESPQIYKSKLETLVGLMRLENMNLVTTTYGYSNRSDSPHYNELSASKSFGKKMVDCWDGILLSSEDCMKFDKFLDNNRKYLPGMNTLTHGERVKFISDWKEKQIDSEKVVTERHFIPRYERIKKALIKTKEPDFVQHADYHADIISKSIDSPRFKSESGEVITSEALLAPGNKKWRKIWSEETGVELPDSKTGTNNALGQYYGTKSNYKSKILTEAKKSNRFDFSVLSEKKDGELLLSQLDYWLTQFEQKTEENKVRYKAYIYEGKDYDPHTIREDTGYTDVDMLKQICETAIHIFADEIISKAKGSADAFEKICNFYAIQPKVIWRSTKSMQLQQYSTPTPIAYLMSKFCIGTPAFGDKYLEPSAGTGLLTIGTPPEYWTVNEIDPDRLLCLKFLGFKNTFSYDGMKQLPFDRDSFNAIVTNPPFGGSEKINFEGYQIKRKEFVMAAYALECMAQKGKAAIIIGDNMKYDKDGYIYPFLSDNVFFNYLYNYYNVVDVISLDGSLYKGMGANAPIRIILIDGARIDKSETVLPFRFDEIKHLESNQRNSPHLVKDFKTLYQRFMAENSVI